MSVASLICAWRDARVGTRARSLIMQRGVSPTATESWLENNEMPKSGHLKARPQQFPAALNLTVMNVRNSGADSKKLASPYHVGMCRPIEMALMAPLIKGTDVDYLFISKCIEQGFFS